MRVVIRVDASIKIGTGHVMRCLTLADALREKGNEVHFICRRHEANLIDLIESKKYQLIALEEENNTSSHTDAGASLVHAHWLGATQEQDAESCKSILKVLQPDWLIVDHYALDYRWQEALQEFTKKLMVIDDLADRKHNCQLLLDQTYGRQAHDYKHLVPERATLLLGSQYALLRPEFSQWRDYSLMRRAKPEFKKLLISMGGVDADNITGRVLEALNDCKQLKHISIIVVMGANSPHLESVHRLSKELPFNIEVAVNVSDMAELMANSDLAIGAAGATTWERCCVGLPSIMIVIADNQRLIADMMRKKNAALFLDKSLLPNICSYLSTASEQMNRLTSFSSKLTDGKGVESVIRYM